MQIQEILNASLLDIIFDGRNKQYGAYQLRKTYNARLFEALGLMAVSLGLFYLVYSVAAHRTTAQHAPLYVRDVQLEEVRAEKKMEVLPPPPPQAPPAKIEVTKFTAPRIVRDNEVKESEKPPEQTKLVETKIGTFNQEGAKDEGIAALGDDNGRGVIAAPAGNGTGGEDYDKTFMKVEIESEYPGGIGAWQRFLNKNLHYPDEAINNLIQGTIVVQFIVDKDGTVSDAHAISGTGQGRLREEAERVIRNSGKWTPAIQNGRKVRSYKAQPIIFMLASQ